MTTTPHWNFDADTFTYVPNTDAMLNEALEKMNALEEQMTFAGVKLWFRQHGYRVEKI